jgi:hypothetical protein
VWLPQAAKSEGWQKYFKEKRIDFWSTTNIKLLSQIKKIS